MGSPLTPVGRADVVWHQPLDSVHFETTTGVFVRTAALDSACEFITDDREDRRQCVYVCLDAPGMGKTTTVAHAAQTANAVYVHMQGGVGVLNIARSKLETELAEAAAGNGGLVESEHAWRTAQRIWQFTLLAIIRHTTVMLQYQKKLHVGFLERNGVSWTTPEGGFKAAVEAAIEELRNVVREHFRDDTRVVLHFDEIQLLLPIPNADGRVRQHRPQQASSPKECMRYILVWFSDALRTVCVDHFLKPCITGISVDADGSFQFDSGMKRWEAAPLPFFDKAKTKEVLLRYVSFHQPSVLEALAAGAQGCPRAVQFVLMELNERAKHESGPWQPKDVLRGATEKWLTSGVGSFLKGNQEHAAVACSALLAVVYPDARIAERRMVDGVPAVIMEMDAVPLTWRYAAHVGLLRLRVDGSGKVMLLPPYPFLEAYIRTLDKCGVHVENCLMLASQAAASVGGGGHFNEANAFELAVALELCNAASPLMRAMLACPALAGCACLRHCATLRPVRSYRDLPSKKTMNDGEFEFRPFVYLFMHASHGRKARPCVIAVPVLRRVGVGTSARTKIEILMVEIKPSSAVGPAYLRDSLENFVQVSTKAPWPLACFITNEDPSGALRTEAAVALTEYSRHHAPRAMGLLIAGDELLSSCTLNLLAVLHAEDVRLQSDVRWYDALYADNEARATTYHALQKMRVRAAASAASLSPGCAAAAAALPSQRPAAAFAGAATT